MSAPFNLAAHEHLVSIGLKHSRVVTDDMSWDHYTDALEGERIGNTFGVGSTWVFIFEDGSAGQFIDDRPPTETEVAEFYDGINRIIEDENKSPRRRKKIMEVRILIRSRKYGSVS